MDVSHAGNTSYRSHCDEVGALPSDAALPSPELVLPGTAPASLPGVVALPPVPPVSLCPAPVPGTALVVYAVAGFSTSPLLPQAPSDSKAVTTSAALPARE